MHLTLPTVEERLKALPSLRYAFSERAFRGAVSTTD